MYEIFSRKIILDWVKDYSPGVELVSSSSFTWSSLGPEIPTGRIPGGNNKLLVSMLSWKDNGGSTGGNSIRGTTSRRGSWQGHNSPWYYWAPCLFSGFDACGLKKMLTDDVRELEGLLSEGLSHQHGNRKEKKKRKSRYIQLTCGALFPAFSTLTPLALNAFKNTCWQLWKWYIVCFGQSSSLTLSITSSVSVLLLSSSVSGGLRYGTASVAPLTV